MVKSHKTTNLARSHIKIVSTDMSKKEPSKVDKSEMIMQRRNASSSVRLI